MRRDRWRDDPGRGSLDRIGPHDGGDRRRKGPRAEAVHAGGQRAPRRTRSGTAGTASLPTKRARETRQEAAIWQRDLAGFHRAAALRNRRAAAVRGRLGARDQVRWLSRSAARAGWRGDAEDTQGLDWTAKFGAIARAAVKLPDGIIDGEIVALDDNGAPDFAALQAALSEGKTDDLIFFAFDLLFDGEEDLRDMPLSERKAALQKLLLATSTATSAHSLRRAFRDRAATRF